MLGRSGERARLADMLDRALRGDSCTLVLHGEAGIGKTSLLADAAATARARSLPVLSARGVEAESMIPYATLSELLMPVLERIGEIPEPQVASLRAALAIRGSPDADRFAVAAGTLSLLAVAAEQHGLLVCLDDAHWVDPASAAALLFAARRMTADGIALVVTARDGEPSPFLDAGFPQLAVVGIDRASAGTLIAEASEGAATPAVADRIFEATAGNPLALIELPNLLDPEQLAGRVPLDEPLRVSAVIAKSFARRLEGLPPMTRRALTVAAASRTYEVPPILAALPDLDIPASSLDPAELGGLISVAGGRISFNHPLLRAAAYHAAPLSERIAVHRALAAHEEPSRAAWHLAEATVGTDERVAALLEVAANDARERTGYAAAGAALERAAALSPHRRARARRMLEAGMAYVVIGEFARAGEILARALEETPDEIVRAQIQSARVKAASWRGEIAFARDLAMAEASRAALVSSELALVMIRDATVAAIQSGAVPMAGEIARRAAMIDATTPAERLLAASPPMMIEVLHGGRRADESLESLQTLLRSGDPVQALLTLAYPMIWHEQYDRVRSLLETQITALRAATALGALPALLAMLGELEFRVGRWEDARIAAAEATRLASEMGAYDPFSAVVLTRLDAAQGREHDCRVRAAQVIAAAEAAGIGSLPAYILSALGLLELGLGRFTEAIAVLARGAAFLRGKAMIGEPATILWAPDLIEAYARAGLHDDAGRELAEFEGHAIRTGRTSARACAYRARGMLASDEHFEHQFEQAIDWHRRTSMPFELARTELAYGERLRRARQRTRARVRLSAALEVFDRLGAEPWAERARVEIRASGQTARRRDRSTRDELTPQELQIAHLVAAGLTNRETAQRLFLSARTIDAHLGRVYRKLGIHARGELAVALTHREPGLDGPGEG